LKVESQKLKGKTHTLDFQLLIPNIPFNLQLSTLACPSCLLLRLLKTLAQGRRQDKARMGKPKEDKGLLRLLAPRPESVS
jgi:hypothetical protein